MPLSVLNSDRRTMIPAKSVRKSGNKAGIDIPKLHNVSGRENKGEKGWGKEIMNKREGEGYKKKI